ncbi:MAG TPA: copper homeostasis protein CutC [Chitinophagaceae bacterium]|nr:copper homeostasis protein CutC [Chitinophagaceae bacterium]
MKLEIIGFTIDSCITAQRAGANRIELCDNYYEGGTTPSYAFIEAARKNLSIELYVMIRPRGGDFLYSADEFDIMKRNIEVCKKLGCDGVVMGLLHADGSIDKKRTAPLVEYAYPLGVTFHRAFDRTNDPFQALEDVIDMGCERILTSGLQPKATDGAALIKQLVQQADDRIIIMPGSGVTSQNILQLAEATGATEFHSSASMFTADTMPYHNPHLEEEKRILVNEQEVQAMSTLLKTFFNTPA